MVQLNHSSSEQPDLRTTEQRIAWGKANGLPLDYLIVSVAEVNQIDETLQKLAQDNMAWRMVARATFGAKDQKELGEAIQKSRAKLGESPETHLENQ